MSRRNGALLLALSAIWGSSFLFIKLGVNELEPSVVALGRLVVGAAILLPIAASRGGLGLLRPYLAIVAALGLLNNALPFWLFGFAETRISSGLAGVISVDQTSIRGSRRLPSSGLSTQRGGPPRRPASLFPSRL